MSNVELNHVLRADQFANDELLDTVFDQAARIQDNLGSSLHNNSMRLELAGKTLFNLFYEPSTRTSFSFQMAASRLGMTVLGTENGKDFSSLAKGESLEDTARTLAGYRPDVFVIRHKDDGAAEQFSAETSGIPVINAGDGKNEHPTQSLLDVYTIQRAFGRRDNLKIAIGGDIAHGRTAKSLMRLLGRYGSNEFALIAPEVSNIGKEPLLQQEVAELPASFTTYHELNAQILEDADVVYWTRTQTERGAGETDERFRLEPSHLENMNPEGIIMHPLPRVGELSHAIDEDPRAIYFEQAANGVPIRMALLRMLVEKAV